MKIGIDLDGVTQDTQKLWHRTFDARATQHGHRVLASSLLPWESYDLAHICAQCQRICLESEEIVGHSPAMIGGPEAIIALEQHGHELVFITHRWSVLEMATQIWLYNAGLGGIAVQHVQGSKAPWIARLGCDAYVDDIADNLRDLPNTCRGCLFDRPYNRHIPLPGGVRRVYGWMHLYNELTGLEAAR